MISGRPKSGHSGSRVRMICCSWTRSNWFTSAVPRRLWPSMMSRWGETSAPTIRMCIRRRGVQRIVTRGTDDVPQITDERPALLCDPDAVRQIAHALQDVTTFYEMPEDPDDVVEWVLNFGRLILVDRSPRRSLLGSSRRRSRSLGPKWGSVGSALDPGQQSRSDRPSRIAAKSRWPANRVTSQQDVDPAG